MLAATRKRSRGRSASRRRGAMSRRLARNPPYISRSRSRTRRSRINLNTHRYSRWTEPATTDFVSQGLPLDFEFKFEDIINASEFSSMYDRFKIDYVVVHFQLINNPDASIAPNNEPNAVNTSTNFFPKLWYIRDYDGGSSETLSAIKERQGVRYFVLRPNKTYTVKLRPMVAIQTYRTSTTTGYAPKRLMLDFANATNVPHYGLKTVFDTLGYNPPDTQPWKLRHEIKYYFTCKDVR